MLTVTFLAVEGNVFIWFIHKSAKKDKRVEFTTNIVFSVTAFNFEKQRLVDHDCLLMRRNFIYDENPE